MTVEPSVIRSGYGQFVSIPGYFSAVRVDARLNVTPDSRRGVRFVSDSMGGCYVKVGDAWIADDDIQSAPVVVTVTFDDGEAANFRFSPVHHQVGVTMPDPDYGCRGLYDKFTVTRNDGSPKHKDCRYFVLDLTHDAAARAAALTYAAEVIHDQAVLALDLERLVRQCEDDAQGRPCPGKCNGANRVHGTAALCDDCGPKT